MARAPIDRPLNVARDLSLVAFENVDINLFDLYVVHQAQGAVIGRTFTGCRLQGPAIVLASGGTSFESTDFGDPRGDIANLLLKPMGSKALGTVPMVGCRFIDCEFYNVGFTGDENFLQLMSSVPSLPGAQE